MIRELTTKLRSKLTANATLVTLTTGVFLRRAPQGQAYGYVTFWPVDESPLHTHDDIIDDTNWQLDVWHSSAASLAEIHDEIKAALDDQTLALSTLTEVGMVRRPTGPLMADHDDQTGTIWHQELQYNIIVQ